MYNAILERVIDGDTCVVLIELGLNVFKREHIRLADVNAPETRSRDDYEKKMGEDAKCYVERHLGPVGSKLRVRTGATGKYGRLVAYVYREGDNVSVNERLIKEGFAFKYDGTSSRERDGHDLDELKTLRLRNGTWNETP